MSIARAVMLPSLLEGCGLPAVEARGMGTPVVVSRDPALMETTRGYATDADAGDTDAWADAMDRMMDHDTGRPAHLAAARDAVLSRDWSDVAREHRTALATLAGM